MINLEGTAYVLVEGHGEVQAVGNLLSRLSDDLGIYFPWSNPIRWKNLHTEDGLRKGAEFIRARTNVRALLILRMTVRKNEGQRWRTGCDNSTSPFRPQPSC